MSGPVIAVVGSINHDLVVRVPTIPRPGETLTGSGFAEMSGGKGANQAVAAARSGGAVRMVGRVGQDSFGPGLLANLRAEGIDVGSVHETLGSSGVAVIAVDDRGENSIVVVPGANGLVTPDDVHAAADVIRNSAILMLQLEVPVETVLAATTVARDAGVTVLLDPAPAPRSYPPELLRVDMVCPNELEAEVLTGVSALDDESAFCAADKLREAGVATVIITRGGDGVTVVSDSVRTVVRAITVDVVDTTAAGDAFAGALAVELAGGCELLEAVRFASVAGALAASRAGAQPSLPTRAMIAERVESEQTRAV